MIACVVIAIVNKKDTESKTGAAAQVTNAQKLGTATIDLQNLPDLDTLAATVNDKQIANSSISSSDTITEQLAKGTYTLKISKLGYTPLVITFSIVSGKTTIIDANPQPVGDLTISSWSQIGAPDPALWDAPSFIKTTAPTIAIVSVQYFYNKTWAVIQSNDGIQPASGYDVAGGGDGYEIAKYDFSTNSWLPIAGTGEFFSKSDAEETPPLVQSYLVDNQLAYPGT